MIEKKSILASWPGSPMKCGATYQRKIEIRRKR
jgi:hypothetical protein